MKILHLSTWKTGGAAIAATRLSQTLSHLGHDSRVLHMSSRFPAYLDAAIGKLAHFQNTIFHSYNYYGENISAKIKSFAPDILHIHWIGAGFIRPEDLAGFGLPIVWTLHDLWPLCGAEHLPGSPRMQDGYRKDNRPAGDRGLDLDRLVWERKIKSFQDLSITYVAPSHYVYDQALSAQALGSHHLEYIENGVDKAIFKPQRKQSSDKLTVLYVANNPRLDPNKGYADFVRAIRLLSPTLRRRLTVKVVGGEVSTDASMAAIYRAATITVVPSGMETLSFVAMESLACGTPVVAYRVGGIPDLVEHQVNGYLAKPGDIQDLSYGIKYLLTHPQVRVDYARAGRSKILANFNLEKVAQKYLSLYQSI